MKMIRRSTKSSDKSQLSSTGHISIPQKDAIAIVPPKKVIKALHDYQAPPHHEGYLSFAQGDFLHVVAREDDPDWYEACNPLQNTRGLVPVNYFELVGKQVRNSAGLEPAGLQQTGSGTHDSGYAEKSLERSSLNGGQNGANPGRKSLGRGQGAMVYGIVQYDFKAERPDELDAKAGEAIIVIAQSNPEWFVAKPITRLGGPGLIPVSFIEVRDMNTGMPVPDAHEAVKRAGVPKVEEWKKMTADYKNSSIPLGRLDMSTTQGLQQGVERMSLTNGSNPNQDARATHQRSPSSFATNQPYQYAQYRASQLLSPVQARVPRYSPLWRGDWWFNVEVTMEDGKAWELFRTYRDFYSLQLNLIEQFPEAAGKVEGIKRTLPYMPGPLPSVTEQLTGKRRNHLDKYLANLLNINPAITTSLPVKGFFNPRPGDGDHEIDPANVSMNDRLSSISQDSRQLEDSRQSSSGNLSSYGSPQRQPQQQQQQQQYRPASPYGQNGPQSHYRNPSELRAPGSQGMPPPMLRNNSAMTSASANSQQSTTWSMGQGSTGTGTTTTSASATTKIKVWFGETNCVMIRLDPSFTYTDLIQKLRDRWSMEPGVDRSSASQAGFVVEYKDDSTRSFYRIENDEDLREAKKRCEKLTLRVEAGAGMM